MTVYGYDELRAAARLVASLRDGQRELSLAMAGTYREAALLLADAMNEYLDWTDAVDRADHPDLGSR